MVVVIILILNLFGELFFYFGKYRILNDCNQE